MTLHQKQARFTLFVARLIDKAVEMGYTPVLGEVQRSQAQALQNAKLGTGIANSLHVDRLAVDLLLFRDGKYLDKTEDYLHLGQWWKSLDPACCRWGGDFTNRRDGNHFSYSPDGKRA